MEEDLRKPEQGVERRMGETYQGCQGLFIVYKFLYRSRFNQINKLEMHLTWEKIFKLFFWLCPSSDILFFVIESKKN